MRIIVTFILVNLMTTGIPESIYLTQPSGNENNSIISSIDNFISDEKEKATESILNVPQQLKEEFTLNEDLISIKILNQRGEVIEKWQGKSKRVIVDTISFLEKASAGLYRIKGILLDGSESSFVLEK